MGKAELMFGKSISVRAVVVRDADPAFSDVFNVSLASAPA